MAWHLRVVGLIVFAAASSHALYSSGSDVVSLKSTNFDRLVKDSDNIWIVEFFAPWCGHCKTFASDYAKAAKALKGVVKVGAVNADEEQSLASQYNVRGFPTVKILYGSKVEDYNGPRSAQGLVDAALKVVRNKIDAQLGGKSSSGGGGGSSGGKGDVVELTDSNFDRLVLQSEEPWLVEFFAPWCGHCKRLEPEWAKAASALKGKIKLGAVDATVHAGKAGEYNVRGYPTIKYFPGGKNKQAEEYNGGRTAEDIINWANEQVQVNLPPPELLQITSNDVLDDACNNHPLCVVSVLPHILDCDAKCRNDYLTILKNQGEKHKKNSWGWLWSQAGDHPKLEEALDIGGFGYPAMAVVNVKKGKYSLFRGSFSDVGIHEFLRDLSYGKGSTAPIRGAELPKIKPAEPWDGKDGQVPVEEDIDLDDINDKDEL